MADNLPYIDYKKYMTDEELKDIRRGKVADFFLGGDRGGERSGEYLDQAKSRVGLEAIGSMRAEMQSPESDMARYDLSGIQGKLMAESGDPEAMERFRGSETLQGHIGDLREKSPSYADLKERHLTSRGLSGIPEVQSYTKSVESRMANEAKDREDEAVAQQEQQRLAGIQESTSRISESIGDEKPIVAEYIKMLASAGDTKELYKTMASLMKSIESAQSEDVGFERDKEEAETGHGYDLDLQSKKGDIDKELQMLRNAASSTGGKRKDNAMKLSGIDSVFNQLKEQHEEVAKGPIMGRVGSINIWSEKRSGFTATRQYLLKEIARSFEGARMSDYDMKFYERMVPDFKHTPEQFDSIRDSITKLVEWRIKTFLDNKASGADNKAADPGPAPQSFYEEKAAQYLGDD